MNFRTRYNHQGCELLSKESIKIKKKMQLKTKWVIKEYSHTPETETPI